MKLFSTVLLLWMFLLVSPSNAQNIVTAFNAYRMGDYAVALNELRPLAERGDVLAQYKLGVMYNNGEGVPQDFREAVNWFYRAATLGYPPAQSSLGVKYEKGQGVKRDHGEAVKWYRHSADQGYATAQFRLGRMYVLGHGVRRDYTEAVAWFQIAADQGVEDAATARDAVAAQLTSQQLAKAERKTHEILR
jgi:TPR repeat protein